MSGISLYQVSRLSGRADRIPQLISAVAECLSYLALTSSFKDDSKPGRSRIGPAPLQPASRQDPGGAKAATHPHVFEAVQARQPVSDNKHKFDYGLYFEWLAIVGKDLALNAPRLRLSPDLGMDPGHGPSHIQLAGPCSASNPRTSDSIATMLIQRV